MIHENAKESPLPVCEREGGGVMSMWVFSGDDCFPLRLVVFSLPDAFFILRMDVQYGADVVLHHSWIQQSKGAHATSVGGPMFDGVGICGSRPITNVWSNSVECTHSWTILKKSANLSISHPRRILNLHFSKNSDVTTLDDVTGRRQRFRQPTNFR